MDSDATGRVPIRRFPDPPDSLLHAKRSRLFCPIIYEQPTAMRLLASPEGVAERSESFKMMIAGGNHTEIKKLAWQIIGTSEPIIYHD